MHRYSTSTAPVFVALLLILIVAVPAQAAPDFPILTGRVVDNAHLLPVQEERAIVEKLAAHEKQTGNQVVVVTILSLEGHTIADYGYQLGRHWGIGQKERDNGALLIVASKDRKLRIEVGYGLEGALTDALSKQIIETIIVPHFKEGNFATGIDRGVDAILTIAAGEEWTPIEPGFDRVSYFKIVVLFIILVGAFSVLFFSMTDESPYGVITPHSRYRDPETGSSGYRSGSSRRSGFGGGGGFSGGGGGFGGGGASGGW